MTQKINDTSNRISHGGRLEDYWIDRPVKQRRSSFVEWDKKDIDMKALLEEYKLKGFEFGRYLNNEDRYDFLIAAKDSLSDLAWLIKTDNIGIEYEIGIAFGARGRGGHAVAHFEPGYNMINLTKTKGASSLAHEYGHALDYVIGLHIDQNKKYAALSAGRSMAKFPEDNTGGTVRLLMRKLIREIKMTQSFARLKDASEYWHYNTEVFARFFEQWCCYTMRAAKKSNSFLTYSWSAYIHDEAYLTEADFKKVLPTGNKLIKNIGLVLNGKKPEAFMDLEVVNPEKVKKAAKPAKAKKAAAPKKTATKAADPKTATNKAPKKGNSYGDGVNYYYLQDYGKAFKAIGKLTGKDPARPIMSGVYHDNGNMVATDAHVLGVIRNAKYPKQKEGKIIALKGGTIEGRYPNWSAVMPVPSVNNKEYPISAGVPVNVAEDLKKAKAETDRQKKLKDEYFKKGSTKPYGWLEQQGFNGNIRQSVIPYKYKKFFVNPKMLAICLQFLKEAGIKEAMFYNSQTKPLNHMGVFRDGNVEVLIMPVMKD
jgi:hypothetical protein